MSSLNWRTLKKNKSIHVMLMEIRGGFFCVSLERKEGWIFWIRFKKENKQFLGDGQDCPDTIPHFKGGCDERDRQIMLLLSNCN